MSKVQSLAAAGKSQNEKLRRKLAALEDMDTGDEVENLGLDFTVPGYDIELKVSFHSIIYRYPHVLTINY